MNKNAEAWQIFRTWLFVGLKTSIQKLRRFFGENSKYVIGAILLVVCLSAWLISSYILGCYRTKDLKHANIVRKDLKLAIDIGHTKESHGATSSRGVGEYYFNQDIAKLLQLGLLQRGFTSTFILNENGSNISLSMRTDLAKKQRARLLLSIHHDSVQPKYLQSWDYQEEERLYCDLFQGYSIFYSEKNNAPRKSLQFATLLGKELRRNEFVPTLHHAEPIEGENRELVDKEEGIYRVDDFVVLKTAEMPAVLLECGVILNRDEEILLSNPVYRRVLVSSIINAIEIAVDKGIIE